MIKLKVGSRASRLALWQTGHFIDELKSKHPNFLFELVAISTTADKKLNTPLRNIGGKGLFIKELETALLDHKIDVALHSLKDVPTFYDDKTFKVVTLLKRASPADAFLSAKYKTLADLPKAASVGTSSLRRHLQIQLIKPDVEIKSLRGNINSRLEKMLQGEFDAIILAEAGLIRLGITHDYHVLAYQDFLPAATQGCLAAQFLSHRTDVNSLVQSLVDFKTVVCADCERSFLRRLGGDCFSAVAALATAETDKISISAAVFSPFGKKIFMQGAGTVKEAKNIGIRLAESMLAAGAAKFMADCTQVYG